MKNNFSKAVVTGLVITIFLSSITSAQEQRQISVWQYRQVKPENTEEFIKRETTYWSEVAKKALDKGNLTFWALLQRVGGYDLENSSNFIFINTYNDIDAIGNIWSEDAVKAAFPNVPMNKIETGTLSKTTSVFFLHAMGWQQVEKAVPANDFKFIKLNYITSSAPGNLIELENKHWAPFIKKAMESGQTTQKAWGNAIVLSPRSQEINANSVSYDLYPNLKEALYPKWDEKTVLPNDGLTEIGKLELIRRGEVVYRIVKVVSK